MREQSLVPDRSVRRLLRHLHRPRSLESVSLAVAIREQVGGATCYEAVISFLKATFSQYGDEGKRYLDLICRSDLSRSKTKEAVALDLNLSPRQYYRYRARAIQILVGAIKELLTKARDSRPLETLARSLEQLDPQGALSIYALQNADGFVESGEPERLQAQLSISLEEQGMHEAADAIAWRVRERVRFRSHEYRSDVLFALACHDFLRSRYHCSSEGMDAALGMLRAHAPTANHGDVWLAICEAEASMHFADARAGIECMRLALALVEDLGNPTLLARAMVKLADALAVIGELDEARRLARAVELYARSVPSFETPVRIVLNRLAIAGENVTPYFFRGPFQSHDEAMLAATVARLMLSQGEREAAQELARKIASFAQIRNYPAVESSVRVTLGDFEGAWQRGVRTADRIIALDALTVPSDSSIRSLSASPNTYAAIADAIRHSSTHLSNEAIAGALAEPTFRALSGEMVTTHRARTVSAPLRNSGISAPLFRRATRAMIETLALYAACTHPPSQRESAIECYRSSLSALIEIIASELNASDAGVSERRVC